MEKASISFTEDGKTIVDISANSGIQFDVSAALAQYGDNEAAIKEYA